MSGGTDRALIEAYVRTGSDEAFSELSHRHVDLVYSAAFRILHNASLAEEVTQRVFVALARNAPRLATRTVLTGWLHETTRNFAVTTIRSEERRRLREQEAASTQTSDPGNSPAMWDRIAPHLDGALAELNEADREAILLRYFEHKTAREIGEQLGLSEEAAQKRAVRALDRLRTVFAERGLVAPGTGLATMLSAQAIQSAPVGLTASVIATATAAEVATATTSIVGLIMASTKVKLGLTAVLLAGISTPLVVQHRSKARLLNEITMLRQQVAELEQSRDDNRQLITGGGNSNQTESSDQEHAELLRLRAEVASLRAEASDARKGHNEGGATDRLRGASAAPFIPASDWSNVGRGSPIETLQTLKWARAQRDTNTIANSLAWADEHAQAKIAAIFAAAPESVRSKYASADAYILSLFDHPMPDDSRRVTGFRVLSENIADSSATIVIEEQFGDGHTSISEMEYVRVGDEWRQALNFDGPSTAKISAAIGAEADPDSGSPRNP